jgi:hypothetical protein
MQARLAGAEWVEDKRQGQRQASQPGQGQGKITGPGGPIDAIEDRRQVCVYACREPRTEHQDQAGDRWKNADPEQLPALAPGCGERCTKTCLPVVIDRSNAGKQRAASQGREDPYRHADD